ncbi:MAG TPA: hypothetical protein VFR15_14045 [Chloroflexia bacterium]|nr:hypothetical protein [Chloroflexia bacterium]
MKRRFAWALPSLFLLLAATFAAALTAENGERDAAAAPAPAQVPGQDPPVQFYTRTLATVSPGLSSANVSFEWVEASGDWVAYGLGTLGCGHCGLYTTRLGLTNVLDGQGVTVQPSAWGYDFSSGGKPVGVTSARFNAPYLVWTQPGREAPQGYTYRPGEFDCRLCYYDVIARRGGAVAALSDLFTDPQAQVTVLDVSYDGQVLVKSNRSSALWTGKIGAAERRQLPFTVNGAEVTEGGFGPNNVVYFIEAGNVLQWHDRAAEPQRVGRGDALRTRGFYPFWHGEGGIYTRGGTGTDGQLVMPGIGSDYDVNTTSPLGDVMAWLSRDAKGKARFNFAQVNIMGEVRLRTGYDLPGSPSRLSMANEKAVYVETEFASSLPLYHLQMVWTLRSDPMFGRVWEKADAPVAAGRANRSWLWGPVPDYLGYEAYKQGPGERRLVQYYDKSRMEINNPQGDRNNPYFVTNGLLAVEMIAGEIQVADEVFITVTVPSTIPVAGDPRKDNPLTPDYATLASVSSLHGENQAPNRVGQPVDQTIDVDGIVSQDSARGGLSRYAAFVPQTGHNIPDVFWPYLQGMQQTYGYDWVFVMGYPISEGYWTTMRVSGKDMPVLVQAYQRRVLTYVPDFPATWRVQMGNVGQHYFEWRYVMNRHLGR